MLVYFLLVVITVFSYFLMIQLNINKSQRDKITITIFFLGYLLLLCLRDIDVGIDTKQYYKYFTSIQNLSFSHALLYSDFEIGFAFLSKIISFFGDFRLYLIIISLIVIMPVLYLYKNEAKGAMFCVSFFLISLLFEMFFSGMRQSIAIAVAVPAYYCAKNKNILRFILIICVAMLFHKSSVILFVLYPLMNLKFTKKWLWIIIPSLIIIYFNRDILFQFVLSIAGPEYSYKYSYLTGTSGQVGLLLLFILLLIYSFVILDEKKATPIEIGLRNILLLSVCIQMFAPLNPTISRINYYFILFIPVAITRINNCCKIQWKQIMYIAIVIMPIFFTFYFFCMKTDSLEVFKYSFMFFS
ncbi:EpsG family protein [Faecalitalea cylindroides]|uniref:EpsG family protein n=1 Tax=Faecalitalea cylindroides TaxID=39483 RepID=UPI0039F53D34